MAHRLLCILAHPDDETLALGGVLARYAAEGVEISLFYRIYSLVYTEQQHEIDLFAGLREPALQAAA